MLEISEKVSETLDARALGMPNRRISETSVIMLETLKRARVAELPVRL